VLDYKDGGGGSCSRHGGDGGGEESGAKGIGPRRERVG